MKPEPVILQIRQVGRRGNLFPVTHSVQTFDDILRNTKRAVKTRANGGSIIEHHKAALDEVLAFLAQILENGRHASEKHKPDFTGKSASMNSSVRQMLWMHRIRQHLKEATADFSSVLPYAGLNWLQAKHDHMKSPTLTNVLAVTEFLEAWRTLLRV